MIKKIKQFFGNAKVKKILAFTGVIAVIGCMSVGLACSAEEATASDITNGISTVTEAVTSQFTISTIASILGIVLAACVGLYLFWWGSRKVVKMIQGALNSRLRLG